jgi:hypothetical protein
VAVRRPGRAAGLQWSRGTRASPPRSTHLSPIARRLHARAARSVRYRQWVRRRQSRRDAATVRVDRRPADALPPPPTIRYPHTSSTPTDRSSCWTENRRGRAIAWSSRDGTFAGCRMCPKPNTSSSSAVSSAVLLQRHVIALDEQRLFTTARLPQRSGLRDPSDPPHERWSRAQVRLRDVSAQPQPWSVRTHRLRELDKSGAVSLP